MTETRVQEKGLIFNMQRYSLHDGPGIRTVVFFKGCPLRCKWCSNPESFHKTQEVAYNRKDCIACFECVPACPMGAINQGENGIEIDRALCNNNLACVNNCPTGALSVLGKWYDSDEVLDIVLKDEAFYKNSGGGVTLSGGEVFLQSRFASEVLKKAKDRGIHTAVETSGYAKWHEIERVLSFTDLFLYDIKLVNDEKHLEYTGVSNKVILSNFEKIIKDGKNIIMRIPMIPTVNMDDKSIEDFIKVIKETGIREVNLLPFHKLGQAKYDMLDIPFEFKDVKAVNEEGLKNIEEKIMNCGVNVKIGG